jgi:hypothetical protein
VETVLDQKDERGVKAMLLAELDLAQVLDRDVEHLSGARPRPNPINPPRCAVPAGPRPDALRGVCSTCRAGLLRLRGMACVSAAGQRRVSPGVAGFQLAVCALARRRLACARGAAASSADRGAAGARARMPKAGREARRRARAGGELQRFAIAVVAAQQADVYMIDEPSSYLDVRQRLKAAQARRPAPHTVQPTSGCFCGSCYTWCVRHELAGEGGAVEGVPDMHRAQGRLLFEALA